MGDNTTKPQP